MLEISLQILPAGVALPEGEVLPQLLVEELVDGGVAVDAGAGVLVPVPDAAA